MTQKSPKSVYSAVGDHVVWLGQEEPPQADEWSSYVALLVEMGAKLKPSKKPVRVLVLTDGCAPTSKQRAELVDATKGIEIYTGVISTNLVMRGVVTVLSWFQVYNQFFLPKDVHAAFDFLHVPLEGRRAMWVKIKELEGRVPGGVVRAVMSTTPHVDVSNQLRSA